MFPDCDTAAAARDLAHQTGTVWYTSYPHRFEPLIVRLKGLLEEGIIGPVYNARLVYGNGTVKNCIGTWRESGYGVLEDLGCHLIDLTEYLFNYTSCDYRAWEASCMESQVLDHCVYATADRKVVLNQSQGEIRIWRKSSAAPDHLQVQVEELHRARLSQSSSPRKCGFHLGFSLVVSHVWNRRDRGGEVCPWRPGC